MDDVMFGGLPPEYEEQFQALKKKQALAQMLQQQAMTEQPTQIVSGHAVRQSPWAGLIRGLGGAYGSYLDSQNTAKLGQLRGQYQKDYAGAVNQMQGMDPKAQLAFAMQSQFPQIRGMAPQLQKRQWEQADKADDRAFQTRQKGGEMVAGSGDVQGGLKLLSGLGAPEGYTPPAPKAPQFGRDPGGNTYGLTYDKSGTAHLTYAPKEHKTSVSVANNPMIQGQKAGMEAWAKEAVKSVAEMGTQARNAQQVIGTLEQMDKLNNTKLNGGPLANAQTWMQGMAKTAGLKIDNARLSDSQYFSSIAADAAQRVIGQYGGNRGVTKDEAALIQQTVPQLQQSPEARALLSRTLKAVALRNIQQYQEANKQLGQALKAEDPSQFEFGSTMLPAAPMPQAQEPMGAPSNQPMSWDDYYRSKKGGR